MGVEYDVVPSVVLATLVQVDSAADAARSGGVAASGEGHSIASACGSGQAVADAVTRLWAQRSETGVRAGEYAAGCAGAVSQAVAAISDGDGVMRQTSLSSVGQAAAVTGFSSGADFSGGAH